MITMGQAVVILDGVTYTGDAATRTVTPLDDRSQVVLNMMGTGISVGPQTDEWSYLTADWENYPLSMIAAFMDVAHMTGVELDWYSDNGTLPTGG